MSSLTNRKSALPGAKYRPVSWTDITQGGAPVGWGLEEKVAGARFYRPVAWNGKIHPFAAKKDAQMLCKELMKHQTAIQTTCSFSKIE